ncbi:hypothetical protein ACIRO3_23480 [Streptomyces sp. NPDC102278]|uniref:hypothetical protein n=1 Tax=Streptomyces sp. NPDC102278 TaxID=3366152 RepID=UPI0038037CE9
MAAALLAADAGGAWAWRRQKATRWEEVRASGLRYALGHLEGIYPRTFELQGGRMGAGKTVDIPDPHVLSGPGGQVHDNDVLVLLTNGRVTADAVTFAKSQRFHLVDRTLLAEDTAAAYRAVRRSDCPHHAGQGGSPGRRVTAGA